MASLLVIVLYNMGDSSLQTQTQCRFHLNLAHWLSSHHCVSQLSLAGCLADYIIFLSQCTLCYNVFYRMLIRHQGTHHNLRRQYLCISGSEFWVVFGGLRFSFCCCFLCCLSQKERLSVHFISLYKKYALYQSLPLEFVQTVKLADTLRPWAHWE